MQLTEFNLKILNLLLTTSNLSMTDLSYQLKTNYQKLKYELDKLKIDFAITIEDQEVKLMDYNLAKAQIDHIHFNQLIFTEKERHELIQFYLLSNHDYVSLDHLMEIVHSSRNTLLQDIKEVKRQLHLLNGQLKYSRAKGYEIVMNPEDRDLVFINLTLRLSQTHFIKYYLEYMTKQKFSFENYHSQIRHIEEEKGIQLTDNQKQFITIALFTLNNNLYQSFLSIKEPNDRLLNLMVNISSTQHDIISDQYSRDILMNFIQSFEIHSGIIIQDKELLLTKLTMHFYPAALRAKYGIHSIVNAHELMNDHLKPIYTFTALAIKALERNLNIHFNTNEIALWSLYFAGAIRAQGNEIQRKYIAVVLCPNGIAVSHALTQTLKQYFQTILFIEPDSLSNVKAVEEQVDIIFSTHPIASRKPVFLISQSLTPSELNHLNKKLSEQLNIPLQPQHSFNDLLQVIKENATIHDEAKLVREIKALFKINHHFKEGYQPMLKELLTETFIQVQLSPANWEEAIRQGAAPLLQADVIESGYIDAMINTVHDLGPYIVIMPEVAIPHARPEDGAKEVGLAFANFKQPVIFPGDKEVKAMIVLSAKDQNAHLKALADMTELLGNEKSLKILKEAQDKESILSLINTLN